MLILGLGPCRTKTKQNEQTLPSYHFIVVWQVPLPHQVRQREQGWVSETHSPKPSNIFLKLAAIERAKSISHAFLGKSLGSRSSSFIRPRTRKQKKKQIWASIPECLSSVKTDQLRCTVRQLMLPGLGILAGNASP